MPVPPCGRPGPPHALDRAAPIITERPQAVNDQWKGGYLIPIRTPRLGFYNDINTRQARWRPAVTPIDTRWAAVWRRELAGQGETGPYRAFCLGQVGWARDVAGSSRTNQVCPHQHPALTVGPQNPDGRQPLDSPPAARETRC